MMQSNKTTMDPGFTADPRSIPPRRISHYGNQSNARRISQNRESKDSVDSNKSKRKDTDDDDSDQEYYNFDKLKKFHIPRKKGQEEKELLSDLSLSSREYTHTIYPTVRSSFFDPQASRKLVINGVQLVQNPALEKEYLSKRRDMKDEGRSEKDLVESFGYLHVFKRSEVEKICKEGLSVGHCNLSTLGKADMGVYVCKHADVVRFSKWEENQSGYIIMFKIIKGKTKLVTECRQALTDQEPTPLYDCHVTKLPIDVAQSIHSRAYQAFQYYMYEYGDIDVVTRPRQVMPYSVLRYTYDDLSGATVAGSRSSRRESSTEELFSDNGAGNLPTSGGSSVDSGFCYWRGKLLVKNGTFCPVELRSHLDTVFNVANIDRSINVKTCLSLDKLKRQLPPTLMSRSAKKHNVIYRGRYYNTFTLHPTEEGSGLGKFRQLVGHLVQRSAAAFVPLRNNSTLYLLPLSVLTEEMGLRSSSSVPGNQVQKEWKNFLHAIIITPKALSSKINDQRVFNIVHARKRKESSSNLALSDVRDALEQKLRLMNIEPSSALSAMDAEQQQKIFDQLKNKKKLQTSEKMLHGYYKEIDIIPSSAKSEWKKKLNSKWSDTTSAQQEMYSGKKRIKLIPPSTNPEKRDRSISKSSTGQSTPDADSLLEDNNEATFSDDEDTSLKPAPVRLSYKIPKKPRLEDPRVIPITNVPIDSEDMALIPDIRDVKTKKFQYTPAPRSRAVPTSIGMPSSILRPSFKPLEELIFSEKIGDLVKHPEFNFSEKYSMAHVVAGHFPPTGDHSPFATWDKKHTKISISFKQKVPYAKISADCPYAFEMDDLIISMLRAIHGEYNSSSDTPQEHDKVKWVRSVLHSRAKTSSAFSAVTGTLHEPPSMGRKIVEHVEEKTSPPFTGVSPHPSSTDSGFVSSSATATPAITDSPYLKDIASILASAISQTKGARPEEPEEAPDMEVAAKALLQALTYTGDKDPGINLSQGSTASEDLDGVDMEIGSSPGGSPAAQRDASLLQETSRSGSTPRQSPVTKSAAHQQQGETGKRHSSHPQSYPILQTSKSAATAVILPEDWSLNALAKIIPGLPREKLKELLIRIVPIVSKLMAKTRGTRTLSSLKESGRTEKSQKIMCESTILRPWEFKTTKGQTHTQTPMTLALKKMTICLTMTKTNIAEPLNTETIDKPQKDVMKEALIPGLDMASAPTTLDRASTVNLNIKGMKPIEIQPEPMQVMTLNDQESNSMKKLTRSTKDISKERSDIPPPGTDLKDIGMSMKNTNTFNQSSILQSGATGSLGYSATGLKLKTTTVGSIQKTETLSLVTHQVGAQTKISKPTTTRSMNIMSSEGNHSSDPPEFSSRINTIITKRESQKRNYRGSDQGILTQISPIKRTNPVPYYRENQHGKIMPMSQSGHYSVHAPASLTRDKGQFPGGGSTSGAARSLERANSISEQNSELLGSILSFFKQRQDPRLASRRNHPTANLYANVTKSVAATAAQSKATVLTTASSTQYSSQVNSILQKLIPQATLIIPSPEPKKSSSSKDNAMREPETHVNKMVRKTETSCVSKTPETSTPPTSKGSDTKTTKAGLKLSPRTPFFSTSSPGGLSLQDIQRIREKKERLKAQKQAEREQCMREVKNMRDELNKSIRKKKLAEDKKQKANVKSPESRRDETHRERKKASKTTFSLDQPASTQVLSDVAVALADTTPEASTPLVTSTRPTGVVTPTLRPVHPIFMQSITSFPLTEVTASNHSDVPSTSEGRTPNTRQVISEIDNTLSELKQAMDGEQSEIQQKDSMAKLLQLVLKLGGVSEENSDSASPNASHNNSFMDQGTSQNTTGSASSQGVVNEGDLRNTINANRPQRIPRTSSCLSEIMSIPLVSVRNAVNSHASAFHWALQNFSENCLMNSGLVYIFDRLEADMRRASQRISEERCSIEEEYNILFSQPVPDELTSVQMPSIDDILDRLRPYIEDLTRRQTPVSVATTEPIISGQKLPSEQEPTVVTSAPTDVQVQLPDYANSPLAAHQQPILIQPSYVSQLPVMTHQIVVSPQTQPTHPYMAIPAVHNVPMQVYNSLPQSGNLVAMPVPSGADVHNVDTSCVTPVQPVDPTAHAHHTNIQNVAEVLRPDRSDCSTPTQDERYPDPPLTKKSKHTETPSSARTNSFFVFDPESSIECQAIRLYLASVKGVHFDIVQMYQDLQKNIETCKSERGGEEASISLEKELNERLPKGTLWVVVRTLDMKHLHSLPHLTLVKGAGAHVQFVSAESVRDIRARQYKNILPGDGGILVPLCLKTLLNKSIVFLHLMLWLLGQNNEPVKNKNKWRMALHQHLLNALQDAEESEDIVVRQNADQVLEWLCHVSNNNARLTFELGQHQCDKMPDKDSKTKDVWNWYDNATDADLSKIALPCVTKLQRDRARQSRHVVLLIDGDPAAACWKPVWQSGVCVSTIEKFVELVCLKSTESVTEPSLSCVLPLYNISLSCL